MRATTPDQTESMSTLYRTTQPNPRHQLQPEFASVAEAGYVTMYIHAEGKDNGDPNSLWWTGTQTI